MRALLIFLSYFLFQTTFAQVAISPQNAPDLGLYPEYVSSDVTLINEDAILNFIYAEKPWLKYPDYELKLKSHKTSPIGNHFIFDQYYKGNEAFYNSIQVSTSLQNKLIQAVFQVFPFHQYQLTSNELINGYAVVKGIPLAVIRSTYIGKENQHWESLVSLYGDTLLLRDLKLYIAKDSLAKARVFLPNPIQSARTVYGTPYINDNNKDVPVLLAEQKPVSFKTRYENDTFKLKTNLLRFGEVSGPVTVPAWSLTDSFPQNRSHNFFEDLNAFYHLTKYSDYLKATGFTSLLDQIIIDAHAFNGGDNSAFDPAVYPYTLEYGTGGVQDAEDGQVVVHEFGHAMSQIASPGTVIGSERSAMEEGNADYVCISYSRTYNDHHWERIFSWDGHNEFWDGFMTQSAKKYPTDFIGNTNNDREIWSTALMCIYEKLGRQITDSLVYSHLYLQSANATMPKMAALLLKTDTLLWAGKHVSDIRNCFVERGILSFGVDVNDVNYSSLKFNVTNTFNWASGSGQLRIIPKTEDLYEVKIYSLDGTLNFELKEAFGDVEINPVNFSTGCYFLHLTEKNGKTQYTKLIKW